MKAGFLFRVLRHRNYRLYFSGQIVSVTGTWMQRVAEGWLVYRLTDSAFMLGLVRFVGQVPSLLLLPLMGVLADQRNRHRILVATQSAAMVQAGLLAVLVLTGFASVPLIAVLAFAGGLVFAVEAPARQSFIVQIVPSREDLANAIAINSAMFNLARIVGPSLAGLVVAAWGEGPVFAINSATYLAVILALLAMKPERQNSRLPGGSMLRNLRQGIAYSLGEPSMRLMLASLAILSVAAFPFITMMPVIAVEILGGGAMTLGFLLAAVGAGAIAGAAFVSSSTRPVTLWRSLPYSSLALGAGLAAISFSGSLALDLAVLPVCGFGMITFMTSCNTVLQHVVEEEKRGRVMSLYTFSVMGTMPLGSLLAGSVSEAFGVRASTGLGAAAAIGLAAFMLPRTRGTDPLRDAAGGDPVQGAG